MIQKHLSTVLFLTLFSGFTFAQTQNLRDASGRKQGYWEATDRNGQLVYTGYFEDDKPVGVMKRYYPTGELRVIMNHERHTPTVRVRFFRQNGDPSAQGNYAGTLRDSVWLFYGSLTPTVSHRIEYAAGKQHGKEQTFYPDGVLAEETLWNNGLKDGAWTRYFNHGQIKSSATYIDDRLEGVYSVFYPDGKPMIEGFYHYNTPDGDWKRYDEDGDLVSTVRYARGKITNEEELDAIEQEFFKKVTEQEGRIPEPTLEDLMRENMR